MPAAQLSPWLPVLSVLLPALLPLPITLAAAAIDLRRRIIPDPLNIARLATGRKERGVRFAPRSTHAGCGAAVRRYDACRMAAGN